ncbi:MAG: hypothetical protein ACFFDS_02675 [Candidatus Thorarchaeota archaeon]
MRKKTTIYKAYCDACFSEITGKIYFGKDTGNSPGEFCKACYVRIFGSRWEYLWFKVHLWVYVIGAVGVSVLVYHLEGQDIYVFWASFITILAIWSVFNQVFKSSEASERRRQDEELKESEKENKRNK